MGISLDVFENLVRDTEVKSVAFEWQIYEVGIRIADLCVFRFGQPQLNTESFRSGYREARFFVSVIFR
ncbi:hypothetical protein A6X20_31435 [Bradyrhizobium elkanii]|nr:hypothetical protein A6X20_31435 [Bradyrhizobium elkanii]